MTASIADIVGIIQGIGSLAAVGAAVWIYAKQYRDKKADDENETRGFVQAIHDEIETVWNDYSEQTGVLLLSTQPGHHYDAFVPSISDGLIIYQGSPARVGKIDDDELRKLIVTAYVGLTGHFNSIFVNNQMMAELEQMHSSSDLPNQAQRIAKRKNALVAYAVALKRSHNDLQSKVKALLAASQAWLASHPAR
ncbi:hypothetical protein PQR14_22190 [Paraburkholderia bryophila]|uniref:hypothetical protein n=1 Tax=Paraburkholderia bryophila TaxID=420952 RepID=UPI0038B6E128